MESKKVITSGSVIPSIANAPLDIRTRVNTVNDIYNIELPFIGMIVYVIDEDKYYKIKTLKSKDIGLQVIEDAAVDTFEEFLIPNFTGALSLNRKADTDVGECSSTLGFNCSASGDYSHAEGNCTIASGHYSHSEGGETEAAGSYSHTEGFNTIASDFSAHAEGSCTIASGPRSHAEGWYTIAAGEYQHVQGRYNIEDTENRYAHIVGNGIDPDYRRNICTLDWDGNVWFKGDVYVQGTDQDNAQKLSSGVDTIHLQNQITLLRNFVDFQIPNANQRIETLQQEVAELRAIIEELKNK
jgi:hypothetical protein